jgi:hypothetical protein
MTQAAKPWDQQPGEPDRWYDRFSRHFLMVGPERSLLNSWIRDEGEKAAKDGRVPRRKSGLPKHWLNATETWKWRERASAYDAAERERQEERRRAEVDRAYDSMLPAALACYAKLTQRIASLEPADLPPHSVFPQFLAVVKHIQEQLGRHPAQRLEVTGPGGGPLMIDVDAHRAALEEMEEIIARNPGMGIV